MYVTRAIEEGELAKMESGYEGKQSYCYFAAVSVLLSELKFRSMKLRRILGLISPLIYQLERSRKSTILANVTTLS